MSFVESVSEKTDIVAIDLFNLYEFKNSEKDEIEEKFKENKNVKIFQGNFYEFYKTCGNFDQYILISQMMEIFMNLQLKTTFQ